jgi:hypothetical protein
VRKARPDQSADKTRRGIGYTLSRWQSLLRFVDDGRIEIDRQADRALNPSIALNRKNPFSQTRTAVHSMSCCAANLLAVESIDAVTPRAPPSRALAGWTAAGSQSEGSRWRGRALWDATPFPVLDFTGSGSSKHVMTPRPSARTLGVGPRQQVVDLGVGMAVDDPGEDVDEVNE